MAVTPVVFPRCMYMWWIYWSGFSLIFVQSYHCPSPKKMPFANMDPSCTIGFYSRTVQDYDRISRELSKVRERTKRQRLLAIPLTMSSFCQNNIQLWTEDEEMTMIQQSGSLHPISTHVGPCCSILKTNQQVAAFSHVLYFVFASTQPVYWLRGQDEKGKVSLITECFNPL